MVLMESYCCYCSVRLGVLVIAVFAVITSTVMSIILLVTGVKYLDLALDSYEEDVKYRHSAFVQKLSYWIDNYPNNVLLACYLFNTGRTTAAIPAIYGALKLKKWFLPLLAAYEFVVFIACCSLHISLMIILKRHVSLDMLIIFTLTGSFYVLFLGYNSACVVALFQIIELVKSERYRALYGDDPFHPILQQQSIKKTTNFNYYNNNKGIVENVRVLTTPNNRDIDEQKRLSKLGLWPRPKQLTQTQIQQRQRQRLPQIISVIPINNVNGNNMNALRRPQALKWWQLRDIDEHENFNETFAAQNWQRQELFIRKNVLR